MNDPVPPKTAHDVHKVFCPQGVYELVSWPGDGRLSLQFDTGSERIFNPVGSTALARLLGSGELVGQFHFQCGHGPSLHVEFRGVRIDGRGAQLRPVVYALHLAADGRILREDEAREMEVDALWRLMQPLPRPPHTP